MASSYLLDLKGVIFLLSQGVADVEKAVRQMDLSKIHLSIFDHCLAGDDDDKVQVEIPPQTLPALKSDTGRSGLQSHKADTKTFRRVTSDGSLIGRESNVRWPIFSLPFSIRDLDIELLQSGAAIYPGCRDVDGRPTIVLRCQIEFWEKKCKTQIAKIVNYFHHISREVIGSNGWTLLIDAREVEDRRLEKVTDVLSATQADVKGTLGAVYVVSNDPSLDLSIISAALQSHLVAKAVILLENIGKVFEVFEKSLLPLEMGGLLAFSQKNWIEYRQRLESVILECYAASSYLVAATEEMMQTDDLPKSLREAEISLVHHEENIRNVLDNCLLLGLSRNEETLKNISKVEKGFPKCWEFCESADDARELLLKVQSSLLQLERLSTERQLKLEGCLQLRQFEERASQVINKLRTEGKNLLTKFQTPGDNLKSAKKQQEEFNKAHEQFKQLVAEGRDVIEEATVLTNLGICDELTGIKEICRELKSCIALFTVQMNTRKETIDNTHSCYQLLDKSFDWALQTMKFIVDLKIEKEMTLMEVEKSRSNLEAFMAEQLPLPLEGFAQMDNLLLTLNNQKLSEQWIKAKGHCTEIEILIQQRHETLLQVLNQMKLSSYSLLRTNSTRDATNNLTAAKGNPAFTLSSGTSKQPYLQHIVEACSRLSSNEVSLDFLNKSGASLSDIPNTSSSSNSTSFDISVSASKTGNLDTSQFDLDTSVSCPTVEYHPTKRLDVIVPPTSLCGPGLFHHNRLRSSFSDFSQLNSSTLYRRSHSSSFHLEKSSEDSRPLSQPFDVREYMLKDSLPADDCHLSEIRPWCSQNTLPGPKCEFVTHKPPTGIMYSSVVSLQHSRNGRADNRNVSVSSSAPHGRNAKPSWKSFRKVLSSLTDRDSNLRKHFFRRSSSEFFSDIGEANSTESLPGRLQDEDATPVDTSLLSKEGTVLRKYGWSQVPSNSHLIYSNRLALASHSQSVEDVRINDDDVRRNRVLSLIVRELIMTESDYINSLDYVITNYIPELLSEDLTQPLRGKKNVIFGNIEKIYEFHNQIFLAKLQRCQNSPFHLGACFLQHESEFYLYALYNKNKPKADMLMEEFGAKFFRRKQRELSDHMDLNSYLLKPVQRMGKYALLLRQIIKECQETHPDFPDLQAALEMVKFQLRHGNDLLAMDCLRDCDVNLQEQGMLLRQHEFLVFRGRKKCLRQVFLFEELIVFSKARHSSSGHDAYIYKNSIKTSDLGLTESVGESGCRFELWFRKRIPGMTYVLQLQSPDLKQQWVDDISRLLWKQTFRNRQRRLAEMACMGIGSKPSLDLKQSKDNINDRFVNISHSERNRAMRPKSVSLPGAYDGRRPRSLISVSSISSAGSSYSSGYGSCLSSGYGAIGGALTTTEESPLEYIQLACEEAASSQLSTDSNNTSHFIIACPTANNSLTLDSGANTSNDSDAAETNCLASTSERSEVVESSPVLSPPSSPMKEDAFTQTTLKRPLKMPCVNTAVAPIASQESDSDEFY